MDASQYLKGIKRHWRLVAACVTLAFVSAWASILVVSTRSPQDLYRATTTLIQNGASNGSGASRGAGKSNSSSTGTATLPLSTIASLVPITPIADAVAHQLHYPGPSQNLSSKVHTSVDAQSGMLRISSRAPTLTNAKNMADAFATQLLAYLRNRDTSSNNGEAASVAQQMKRIGHDITALDHRLARYGVAPSTAQTSTRTRRSTTTSTPSRADPLIEERDAALRQLGTLSQQYQEIKSRPVDAEGLSVFQPASADGITHPGFAVPRSLSTRLGGGLILGLLGGLVLALLRVRLDKRISTKEAAEDLFGYPVVAEIPRLKENKKSRDATRPPALAPLVADAFRVLGAGLHASTNGNGAGHRPGAVGPRVILVTSAGPKEGKTTVVANLASTLAQVGKTVLLLSCDFRHPDLHRRFGVPNEQGLAEALADGGEGRVLDRCTWFTSVNGVWLVPSGVATKASDQLLASKGMRAAITEARQRCDVVLIDTSPVLTSDVAFLIPQVDGVLIVAKGGRTKPDLAARSGDLLKRLSAPVLGVVFSSDQAIALPKTYYKARSFPQLLRALPIIVVEGSRNAVRVAREAISRGPRVVGRMFHLGRDTREDAVIRRAQMIDITRTDIDVREFPDFRVGPTADRI